MPFFCSICNEESTRICVRCTKDACNNHLCEKCLRCSDCCECAEPLTAVEAEETVPAEVSAEVPAETPHPVPGVEVSGPIQEDTLAEDLPHNPDSEEGIVP